MAVKQVVISDIGGDEVSDDQHARVVVEHPDFPMALEIDATTDEASKFQSTALRLVNVTVYAPNVPPRSVTLETKILDKLFGANVDFNKVLEGARKADAVSDSTQRRGRPQRAPTAAKNDQKIDYTAPDRYGQLHRGRLTEEEIALVKANREQASKNRQAQGHPAINWDDPKEKARYKL